MKLSKKIPARTKTVKFSWCRKNYYTMGQGWRDARNNLKKLDKCYWCGHVFIDGESMGLASAEKQGNKILCGKCADELIDSDN